MNVNPDTLLPLLLRSPVHVDVFAFCLRNPGLHVRTEHLSRSLGRSLRDVEEALDDLAGEGWLVRQSSPSGDTVQFLAPPPAESDKEYDRLEPYLALLRSASRPGR